MFRSALRRHEKNHERSDPVKCKECGGTFRDETLLKRHVKYAHNGMSDVLISPEYRFKY